MGDLELTCLTVFSRGEVFVFIHLVQMITKDSGLWGIKVFCSGGL